MNDKSFECAEMAAGSAIQLTKSILEGDVQNGMALIRPPGHHAMQSEGNGFCLFNNVAIAAKYALKEYSDKVKKVLIVDWDVHHGQASQYCFYDNPNVMYFSIHRYCASSPSGGQHHRLRATTRRAGNRTIWSVVPRTSQGLPC